ncbi:MAG TPA: hypothetical protein VFU41_13765 [Gemmatimonadales bacterium]|nr:hypothetical protein [Gemmatimonadales bacterium]
MTFAAQSLDRGQTAAAPALKALTDLFDRLHREGIRYCHWKSNEHLHASMSGRTDVDLLVDRLATQALARVLAETTFKRFTTMPGRSYPAIESYLGFDADSGKLLHLHLHYRLTLGEKHLKGYRLPWEELLLSTRKWDDAHRIYVADPHIELVLLTVRAALKLRLRDVALAVLRRPYFRRGLLREFRWLVQRVEGERLRETAASLVGARAAASLLAMVFDPSPTVRQLLAFRRAVRPPLGAYRTYGAFEAWQRRWAREGGGRLAALRRRLGLLVPTRRVSPHGGLLVAVVGPDGSGKSTVTHAITRWLAADLDAVRLYFGNGKGPISLSRRLLELVAGLARRTGRARARGPAGGAASRFRRGAGTSRMRDWGDLLWVLSLTRERRIRFRQARRARNLGLVVICDRFPQAQLPGLNDGPWLGHWLRHPSWIRRAAARSELAAIRLGELQAPDLVVKLHVPIDTALGRRPNIPSEQLARKAEEVSALRYPGAIRTVDIDASQPLERVLLEVKRALWACL